MNNRSTSRWRRAAAIIAGLAAASVALSGCLYAMIPEQSSRPATSSEPDTEGVAEDLLPFYSQDLTWTECGVGFDCTDVTAPLDWEDPGKGEITLSVVRHRAEGTPVGSLLTNPGGPGASGVDLILNSLDFAVGADLIENFDVIGFDPRGVGDSTAVKCYDAPQMDDYLYGIPSAARGTAEWEAELLDSHKAFAEACDANSNGILPYITTVNAARDMDLIRAVLGDKQLNYLGYSYGTFLGATYAKLYPEKAGRLVLDGAIDPAVPGLEVGATQALGFESALRAYMQDCLDSGECPFNGTVDEAMADLGALLASVDSTPLKSGDGRMLGADSLMTAIIAALYSQDSWGYLTQALDEALQGDPTSALFLADFYNGRENGTYTDNSAEAFRAYNCMDYPVEDDPAAEAATNAKIAEGAPTIAPYWTGPDSCAVWPYPPTGTRGEIKAEGAGPILVIGTTNDPATPYEWSESLAKQLEEGILITRVGEGHTGYNKGNACVDDAVEAFLLDDVVPEDGLRCE
ncbi:MULTISPECIES: alpha/beta hydrolase [unclassified Microbacterium]|uniref:alpha/beta hydrolase n=1 Tax=unclassified Microbacterium TaxID=2609290 RepID=UPI000493B15A|nr:MULTISPECIES: alpha/beta hydrolase [unclassified Microbacterium]MCV0334543.1 alpha/beta hydrolase [Microbacterium sp.]MCV0376271.1 alpha/beta hydrolase [Microbacterium sp.]MCV0389830.1 alpha/beta hydrolase [Microbacterium sp.]MCV0419365.1 alpha/beta hydrolase [Microbacterium sp.]MCV0421670.1 alpha/beta hydrolase [Microbacterium sp.]